MRVSSLQLIAPLIFDNLCANRRQQLGTPFRQLSLCQFHRCVSTTHKVDILTRSDGRAQDCQVEIKATATKGEPAVKAQDFEQ